MESRILHVGSLSSSKVYTVAAAVVFADACGIRIESLSKIVTLATAGMNNSSEQCRQINNYSNYITECVWLCE